MREGWLRRTGGRALRGSRIWFLGFGCEGVRGLGLAEGCLSEVEWMDDCGSCATEIATDAVGQAEIEMSRRLSAWRGSVRRPTRRGRARQAGVRPRQVRRGPSEIGVARGGIYGRRCAVDRPQPQFGGAQVEIEQQVHARSDLHPDATALEGPMESLNGERPSARRASRGIGPGFSA
jgi:hypothetical protein